jgi:hypothetical protein
LVAEVQGNPSWAEDGWKDSEFVKRFLDIPKDGKPRHRVVSWVTIRPDRPIKFLLSILLYFGAYENG